MLCVVYVVKCSVLCSAQCYLLLSSWTRKTRLPSMLQTSALFFLQWADRFHRADRITWAQVVFSHSRAATHHSALLTLLTIITQLYSLSPLSSFGLAHSRHSIALATTTTLPPPHLKSGFLPARLHRQPLGRVCQGAEGYCHGSGHQYCYYTGLG